MCWPHIKYTDSVVGIVPKAWMAVREIPTFSGVSKGSLFFFFLSRRTAVLTKSDGTKRDRGDFLSVPKGIRALKIASQPDSECFPWSLCC